VLKFYEGYVIKNSGTGPLSQTLSRVNLNPTSVPAQNDTNFPQSVHVYTWTIFLNIFIENVLKYKYQEQKVEQTVVRRYHKICFWQRIDGVENSCE